MNNFFQNLLSLKIFFKNSTLRSRIITWFSAISILPLIWIAFITYEMTKQTLINVETGNLKGLSSCKTHTIELFFKEKDKAVIVLAQDSNVINIMKNSKEYFSKFGKIIPLESLKNNISSLKYTGALLDFYNFYFINKSGEVVFSILPSELVSKNLLKLEIEEGELDDIFLQSKNMLETSISNFTYFNPSEPPSSFISTPIISDGRLIGVLIAQINNHEIYNIITNYDGLGLSGETILVTKTGNDLYSQTPLRHANDKNYMHLIPEGTPFSNFVEEILDGKTQVSNVIDYRGVESLMSGNYLLPALNWGIITKIDMQELLNPIEKLKILTLLLALTTSIVVIFIGTNVANNITHPILVLTKKTRLMAAGDLSQHIVLEGDDELTRLAESFNEMATKLNLLIQHLDFRVAERTTEVEDKNIELTQIIQELKKTQDRLINQEKLASLGSLTAGIAHEIKNPLNFINNFAELSLQIDKDIEGLLDKIKDQLSEEDRTTMQEYLDVLRININKINEHGKRADSIVRNMLQHSRGSTGEIEPVNINEIINEYISLSYHGMRAQDPTFNVKIEKELDPTIPIISIVVPEINRVLLNILNNAYYSVHQKAKQTSNYQPIVKVSTLYDKNNIYIKIWDNGLGISEKIISKLFTPFFTTKPTGEGTGLGLSLSYNIVVYGHNGNILVNSKLGDYAEFIIVLPLKG